MTRLALSLLFLLAACNSRGGWHLKPATPAGPPLRTADRLYLLTTQHNLLFKLDSEEISHLVEREVYTDLWIFDASTVTPLSRNRLHTARTNPTARPAILRAEGGSLIVRLPDGTIVNSNIPFPNAIAPAYRSESSSRPFRVRGLLLPGRWLGLLDDSEAAALRDKNQMYPDLDRPARRKLWSALVNNNRFSALNPLTAEFDAPGLLHSGGQPLLFPNPDSVLIHYQDRQLARIATAGNTLWTTQLPFPVIQSVLPGETALAFLGAQPGVNDTARYFLTAVALTSGGQRSYELTLLSGNPPATPAVRP